MLKVLKLQKAVIVIILGVLTLIVSQMMSKNKVNESNFVLGLSGALLIMGALLFLYPILFAKKADPEGEHVELKPVGKELADDEVI